jgi:hypothetical protein
VNVNFSNAGASASLHRGYAVPLYIGRYDQRLHEIADNLQDSCAAKTFPRRCLSRLSSISWNRRRATWLQPDLPTSQPPYCLHKYLPACLFPTVGRRQASLAWQSRFQPLIDPRPGHVTDDQPIAWPDLKMAVLSVSAGVATIARESGRESNVANFRNAIAGVFISGSAHSHRETNARPCWAWKVKC